MPDSKANKVPIKISRELHAALKVRQFQDFQAGGKADMSDMADEAISLWLQQVPERSDDVQAALEHPRIGPIIRELIAYVSDSKRNTKKTS